MIVFAGDNFLKGLQENQYSTSNDENNSFGGLKENQYSESLGNIVLVSRESIPQKVISSSDSFLESFLDKDDLEKNFKLGKSMFFSDSTDNSKEYILVYNFQIESYRGNGKRTVSIYPIEVRIDEYGSVIDDAGPVKKYNFLKTRGV